LEILSREILLVAVFIQIQEKWFGLQIGMILRYIFIYFLKFFIVWKLCEIFLVLVQEHPANFTFKFHRKFVGKIHANFWIFLKNPRRKILENPGISSDL
jgi:hypothetical protein